MIETLTMLIHSKNDRIPTIVEFVDLIRYLNSGYTVFNESFARKRCCSTVGVSAPVFQSVPFEIASAPAVNFPTALLFGSSLWFVFLLLYSTQNLVQK